MKITARNVDRLQHVGISRLTLYVAGRIHAAIYPFQAWLVDEVRQAADGEGAVDGAKISGLLGVAEARWREVMRRYTALLRTGREQAGDIAFTSLRVKNSARLPVWVERGTAVGESVVIRQASGVTRQASGVGLSESFQPVTEDWTRLARMWTRRRNQALEIAGQRIWGDGLNLSQRIWRLENGGLLSIRRTLAAGMANRTNAWQLATELKGMLGAGRDFPRWTEERLYALSPRRRAQDLSGLLRAGDAILPGESRGVAYNALRLARNEIQIANHAMTTEIATHFPGIVGRKSRLSPEHPATDICDDYAAGGPYAVTENFLPLHPQCLCFYEEVLMPKADFAAQVRGWVAGEGDFLDGYVGWLDQRAAGPWPERAPLADVMDLWLTMQMWMDGNVDAMAAVIKV